MEADKAIELIHEQVEASTEFTKAANLSNRGTKGYEQREQAAARALFIALVGRRPLEDETQRMVSL